MTRLNNMDELKTVMRPYSRKLTNNYLLPYEINNLIKFGNLSYVADENAVYLFERREGYLKLFFQLSGVSARLPEILETLVTYVVSRDANANTEIKDWLKNQGFTIGVKRIHLVAEKLDVEPSSDGVSYATQEEARDLFNENFDPLCADLPLPGHYGELLAVRSEDSEVQGILHTGNPVYIAVRESARRQGTARRLFAAHAASTKQGLYKLWTDEDNYASQSFYHKLGFKTDNLIAECYIKKRLI